MDKIKKYRQIIRTLMNSYADRKPSHGNIDSELIVDAKENHYELMHIGWDGQRRIHGSVIHIDIIGDKVWIQHDGTSYPISDELVTEGIPKESIVLGFYPIDARRYTGFAVE